MAIGDRIRQLNGPLPGAAGRLELDQGQAVMLELEAIRQGIDDLVDLLSGATVILERKVLLGSVAPGRNPVDFVTDGEDPWYAVLIENPNALAVHVGFGGGDGLPGRSSHVIPAQRAVMLSRPFTVLSVGVDPAVVPANAITVTTTRYRRPMQPTGWTLA
jgi:hypothetical protein